MPEIYSPLSCTVTVVGDAWPMSVMCSVPNGYGYERRPIAVRVGYVLCEYCATSQERPPNGRCCACGGPTPHVDEGVYTR